jgi:hypothetical protein
MDGCVLIIDASIGALKAALPDLAVSVLDICALVFSTPSHRTPYGILRIPD